MISYWTVGTGWVMGPLDERGNEGGEPGSRGLAGGGAAQEGQVMSSNVASSRGAGGHGFKMVAPKTPSPPYPRGLHGEASRDAESKPDL